MTVESFQFSVVLTNCHEVVDDMTQQAFLKLSNELFAAGCDDASPGVIKGEVVIDFVREAASLRESVQTAIRQIEQAGYQVAEVRPEGYSIFQELNDQLAKH